MWGNEGTPTMSLGLYTINVECMCDASYVTWKYRQYRRLLVIFARKYKTLQNVKILGARFHSIDTSFFVSNNLPRILPYVPSVNKIQSGNKKQSTNNR